MLEPLTKYRTATTRKFEADLLFEGLRAPLAPDRRRPFWRGRHFDQAMHVTGQVC
jgi:hypothetical protein